MFVWTPGDVFGAAAMAAFLLFTAVIATYISVMRTFVVLRCWWSGW